jgi:hypothetical protein
LIASSLLALATVALATAQSFERVAASRELELYLNKSTGFIAVKTLADGVMRYSSPLGWESDRAASGFNKNALPSLLSIRSMDQNRSILPANSYVNVVKRSGLGFEPIQNGVRILHSFKREGITIPVDVTVDGPELKISVELGRIKENPEGDLSLLDFALAPYFAAAGEREKGYIFVPDGPGAIIRFGDRSSAYPYQQYVYGRDPSIVPTMKKTVTETAYLPVFGMASESGSGFLAVIEEGAARAIINAEAAGQKSSYNAVSASCILRDYDVVTIRERTGTPRDIKLHEKGNFKGERFALRYFFLSGRANSYVGMAEAYRGYLQRKGRFPLEANSHEPELLLDFIGSGPKTKPVLGVPAETTEAYTPFASARAAVEYLKSAGVPRLAVKYEGWARGGIMAAYPAKASPERALGGRAAFASLASWLDAEGIDFYPAVDFVHLYDPDLGHIVELAANRGINRAPAKISQYRLTTFDPKTGGYSSWLLKEDAVRKGVASFDASLDKKWSMGLAPDSLGGEVASDFSSGGTSRQSAADSQERLLASLSGRKLCLSRPYDYALKYASLATDLPTESSRFDVESDWVPFYQILLQGYVPFTNAPGNRDLGRERYKLALVETGAQPSYLVVAQNAEAVRDTRLDCYLGIAFDDWKDEAAATYAEVAPLLKREAGKRIVAHELLNNGLRRTVFEGGFEVVVNYSERALAAPGGRTVAAHSYIASDSGLKGEAR